ncbi:MAG TPA: DNA polymerase/3'-5' exonuclease PolX [Methanomassiliicoccales archaeon]|nr:DNA polymerase/3'-5' exonuclease PolX [Methanomassiliicoccales archaeon]
MLNRKVANILFEIADLLELKEENFKPQAYRKVARAVEDLQEDIEAIAKRGGLRTIPGVGEAIEAKIKEIIQTGELQYLNEIMMEYPAGLMQVMEVPEIGPKTAIRLYKELKITNLDDLRKAAEEHRLQHLKGFGEKTEESILKGIQSLERIKGRMLLGYAHPIAVGMVAYLRERGGLRMVEYAGSLRRMRETIGDIDILVGTDDAGKATETFLSYPEVEVVVAKGPTRSTVRLRIGVQVDLRVVPVSSYGAALLYFTGSKEHNIKLRTIAADRGMKLNEYGLLRKDGTLMASATESDIYAALSMDTIPPEMREDNGEVPLAQQHDLPELIELRDIKGDLHIHTIASDGADRMEDMARAAMRKGYEYIGISDHSEKLKVASGLSLERLRQNMAEARRLSELLSPFRVLIGAEVEIDERGGLDYPPGVLKELDYVIGAVHSRFKMEEKDMTERIITAISNEELDILAHPSGRLIGLREAYAVDMAKVMETAKAQHVALEVNSFPDRLDLNSAHCRMARDQGNIVVINTDSHSEAHLENIIYGVSTARRGWVGPEMVLNTRSLKDVTAFFGA